MFVEGRVLTTGGKPIPGAVVETWETDGEGEQDVFYVFPPDDGFSRVPQTLRSIRYAIR
jgi:protocatechuate 3,4-dioxygenase beta subunit